MSIDFLPTFCAMAGLSLPAGVTIDGKDLTAMLTKGAPSPHDQLVLFDNEDPVAIRTQRWKYVSTDYYRGYNFEIEHMGYPQLYDMAAPTQENYSVAQRHPDVVRDMQRRLAAAQASFAPFRWGKSQIVDPAKLVPQPPAPQD
jgi:arylsulfatase A-like enzyme